MNLSNQYESLAEKYVQRVDAQPLNVLYERPNLLSLLPPLKGLDILDAGCGSGWYSEYMAEAGGRVWAYDPSARMSEWTARRLGHRAKVMHSRTEELKDRLGGHRFGLVVSSMVLHYVDDLRLELSQLRELLHGDGCMVVSMHHPLLHIERLLDPGYQQRELMTRRWPWLEGDVSYFRRPLGEIFEAIRAADFFVDSLLEPRPHERLRDLYLLTLADMSMVAPGNLTTWKEQLLRELYQRVDARYRRDDAEARLEQIIKYVGIG